MTKTKHFSKMQSNFIKKIKKVQVPYDIKITTLASRMFPIYPYVTASHRKK